MKQSKAYDSIGLLRPIIVAILIILLFFQYNVTASLPLAIAGIGLMGVAVIFFNPLESFLIAIALNSSIRMIRIIDNPMAIQGYFMFLLQFKYFCMSKRKYPFLIILNLILAFFTAMLCNASDILSTVLRGVVYLLFMYNVFDEKCTKKYLEHTIMAFIVGTVVSQTLTIYITFTQGLSLYEGSFSAMNNDRNFNAAIIAEAIAVCLLFMLYQKRRIIYIAATATLAFTGLLSGSRTFLLSLGIIMVGYVFILTQRKHRDIQPFVRNFVIITTIGIMISLPTIIEKFDDILFSRFENEDMSSGNGRFDIWAKYLSITFQSLQSILLGNGFAHKFIESGIVRNVEHSVYIQSIFQFGFCGFFTLICSYIKIFRKIVFRHIDAPIWSYIPLLVTLFFYASISALYSAQFDTSMLMSFVIIRFIQTNYTTKTI